MVVVLVKAATATATATVSTAEEEVEQPQFLYECRCSSTIDDIADAVFEIHSLQYTINRLCALIREHLLPSSSSSFSFRENHPDVALSLERTLSEAETYTSKDQVVHQRLLSPHALRAHIEIIKKQAKVALSMRYPEVDVPKIFSDADLQLDMQLWWAGKELLRGKRLSDYIGSNDKTKIVITLKPSFQG